MFKKHSILLLFLFLIVGTKQTFAADSQKASPAVQQFFEAGNHDDAKYHMLGYLANHKRLASLIEEKGAFADALKTLVNRKDKTLQQGLEKLLAPINQKGRQSVHVRNIKIQCAQDAVKSGNQKMLETFLPEIFTENPEEHMLFPQDLTSDDSKELLKQTGLLDLACRYHANKNIAKTIASKFLNSRILRRTILHEYAPVYVANGQKTDMHVAIDNKDQKKIQELLDGEKDRNIKLKTHEKIINSMKDDSTYQLWSLLKEIFPQEKSSFDRELIKKNKRKVKRENIAAAGRTFIKIFVPILKIITLCTISLSGLKNMLLLSSFGGLFFIKFIIGAFGAQFLSKFIRNFDGFIFLAYIVTMITGSLVLAALITYKLKYLTIKSLFLTSSGLWLAPLLFIGASDYFVYGHSITKILGDFLRNIKDITRWSVISPLKKVASTTTRSVKSFFRSPWQNTKKVFNVICNPISYVRTKLLHNACPV